MPVRIGFAGTGGIAAAHLINLVRIAEAEVVALYDVDKERCDLAMRRINGQQEQLARAGEVVCREGAGVRPAGAASEST